MTTADKPDAGDQELANVVRGIRAEAQFDQEGDDPDLVRGESPGVAAVRERLEEPFDYDEEPVEPPNQDGYV